MDLRGMARHLHSHGPKCPPSAPCQADHLPGIPHLLASANIGAKGAKGRRTQIL